MTLLAAPFRSRGATAGNVCVIGPSAASRKLGPFLLRSAAASGGDIGEREHVQAREQQQGKWKEWCVNHPRRRLAHAHGDEIGDDGQRKGNRQPRWGFPNPLIPVQRDLLRDERKLIGATAWRSIEPRQDLLQICKEL